MQIPNVNTSLQGLVQLFKIHYNELTIRHICWIITVTRLVLQVQCTKATMKKKPPTFIHLFFLVLKELNSFDECELKCQHVCERSCGVPNWSLKDIYGNFCKKAAEAAAAVV